MTQSTDAELSIQSSSALRLNELNKLYREKEKALGVSDADLDLLQIEVLTNLEKCSENQMLNVDIVETNAPENVMDYHVHLSTYVISGQYTPLLKLLHCMEGELKQGVISSVKFQKNEKNIELRFTVQNITTS